jgi:predicted AAA+ superfamily ATPase
MFRKSEKTVENWIVNQNRKPLVVRGARQVGKSTLIRNVTRSCRLRLVEVNCEKHPHLDGVFASLNTQKIIDEIESLPGIRPLDSDSVLFLDEVQATPQALAALRYFHEERPEIKVVCAGSLLEFALDKHEFSMPVGRIEFHQVVPMDFEEFLLACGEENLHKLLQTFTMTQPLSIHQHNRLLELQQLYLFVGGMPEAIGQYVAQRKVSVAREVHESILETYRLDFAKYGLKHDLPRLGQLLDRCASQVSRRIKFTNLLADEQSRTVRRLLNMLIQARLLSTVTHSDANDSPLAAEARPDIFKLLLVDVGLLNALVGATWNQFKNPAGAMNIRDGAVAEQFVGQELISTLGRGKQELNYWLRDGKTTNAEVDYVAAVGDVLLPVEVKAGKSGTLRSLRTFCEGKRPKVAFRFDTQLPSIQQIPFDSVAARPNERDLTWDLISLPLYACSQLARIFQKHSN